MPDRLADVLDTARELGFTVRDADADRVSLISDDAVLVVHADPEGRDLTLGFEGTPWHCHDPAYFARGEMFVPFSVCEVVIALALGELVVVSYFQDGQCEDRCLEHQEARRAFGALRPGDYLTVRRFEARGGGGRS